MKQWIEIWHTQKRMGKIINYVYDNGTGKKIVGHSKLKLWTFFWGQGECEWPLVGITATPLVLYMYNSNLEFWFSIR